MELAPERIVDEVGLLLLGRSPRAVLEDDVVVPAPLHPHVRLLGGAGVPVMQHRYLEGCRKKKQINITHILVYKGHMNLND